MARILVVDDCSDIRVSLRCGLKAAGHDIVLASDGSEGLRRAAEGDIDLVLADVNMPGMDGVAMCRAIRALPGRRSLPVLLMTGCPGQHALGEAQAAGAGAVLRKPFVLEELATVLRSHLNPGQPEPGSASPATVGS